MYDVVLQLLRDFLPSNQDFVIRNLQFLASVRGRGQVLSLVMLFITSTGIFLPLEVALNSIWGFTKNRSYLMNALVSVGLASACGSAGPALRLSHGAGPQHSRAGDWRSELCFSRPRVCGDEGVRGRSLRSRSISLFTGYCLTGKCRYAPCCRRRSPWAFFRRRLSIFMSWLLPWLNFQEVYGPSRFRSR